MKNLMKTFACTFVLASLLLTHCVQADVLIDTVGDPSNASTVAASQFNAIGFSLSGAASNVLIEASLVSTFADQTGTAYLTTAIGPGTTNADVIASGAFTFTLVQDLSTELGYVSLFSGLNLAADDYFLTFGSPIAGSGAISLATAAVYVTDPIASVGDMWFSLVEDPAFAPASDFTTSGLGNRFFRVTSKAIPEPSAFGLIGLAGVALLRRRRQR